MLLPCTRKCFCEKLLARVWCVATSSPVGISAYIAVRVSDIVFVFLVELLVRHLAKALPPECNTFVQGEPNAFEEESILQTSVMLEMVLCLERVLK